MYAIQLGVAIASLFNEKVRKMWRGEREAFRILKEQVDPNAQYVWFHAASLGEFEQGRPIIEQLRKEYPEYKILLTFYSPSGYEVRKNYQGADIICYMPIDTVTNARRFLRLVRPCMAFFISTSSGTTSCISLSTGMYLLIASALSSVPTRFSSVGMERTTEGCCVALRSSSCRTSRARNY